MGDKISFFGARPTICCRQQTFPVVTFFIKVLYLKTSNIVYIFKCALKVIKLLNIFLAISYFGLSFFFITKTKHD